MKPEKATMNKAIFKILFGDYDKFLSEIEIKTNILHRELNEKLQVYKDANLNLYQGEEAIEKLIAEIKNISDIAWESRNQIEAILQNKENTDGN